MEISPGNGHSSMQKIRGHEIILREVRSGNNFLAITLRVGGE
jgi:hypothetical protein